MSGVFLRSLALGLVLVAGCDGESSTAPPFEPSGYACSAADVHFLADVAPVFGTHCAGVEGCHVSMHEPSAAYSFLVGQEADECSDGRLLVEPGDAEHSYAIHKMTNTNVCAGAAMPKSDEWIKLPDEKIQTVYDWICAGAKDD